MKAVPRIGVLILLICSMSTVATSQLKFSLGAKTGLNFATISVDPDPYQGTTTITKSGVTSFIAAAQLELLFSRMFGVQIEPGYNSNATRWQDQQGGKRTITVSKIEIPILFKVLFLTGMVQPYAIVGPHLGIVASASDKLETQQGTQDTDIKSTTSSLDFALAFGGGARFNIAQNIALTGDIRYALGLSNLDARQIPQGVATTPSAKSRSFMLLFGALFTI